ncbi:MAG: BrnT family toxin [Candidatus Hydrogenedentes bacterium]|nr:BrnT family toxin [Candidatus Hydrogenedentota bacterium]
MYVEWDPQKAGANFAKHGIMFEEARSVMLDRLAKIHDDEVHSADEHREIIIGHSDKRRLLVVSFTARQDGVRIISARRATRRERLDYEEFTSSEKKPVI